MSKNKKYVGIVLLVLVVLAVTVGMAVGKMAVGKEKNMTDGGKENVGNGRLMNETSDRYSSVNANITSIITNVAYTNPVTGTSVFGKIIGFSTLKIIIRG
jgi:hypothetical protein